MEKFLLSTNWALFAFKNSVIALAIGLVMVSCGGGNQSSKKPNDKVVCGDKSYVFRIGEITSDKETNTTTIQLLTDGQRIPVTFSMSNIGGPISQPVISVLMKIIIGNRTIECNDRIGMTNEAISFTFNTLDTPDKIIVYSNDDRKSTVAYDGKTKEVVFVD